MPFARHKLTEAREAAGLTLADLSRRIETPVNSIRKYERGILVPTVANLERIAVVLGLKVDDFLEGPVRVLREVTE